MKDRSKYKTSTVTINLTADDKRALKDLAREREHSMSWMVRQLIRQATAVREIVRQAGTPSAQAAWERVIQGLGGEDNEIT